jgi:flagellar M-ring protein FliF
VNDRLAKAASRGKAAEWQPRSAEELRNLNALAQAAVGYEAARGDMLTVEDLAFDENRLQAPVSLIGQGLATAENSPVLVKYAALLVGLLVVLAFGVRPAIRGARPNPEKAVKGGAKGLPANASAAADAKAPALKPPEIEMEPERTRTQEIFEQVTGHLKREPTQSSRLLQSWIHSE